MFYIKNNPSSTLKYKKHINESIKINNSGAIKPPNFLLYLAGRNGLRTRHFIDAKKYLFGINGLKLIWQIFVFAPSALIG